MCSFQRLDNLFEWDEIQQGHVLGAFFWLHWVSQVPGGMLARKYGTKKVFGLANLCISLMAYLIPFCAKWSFGALVAIRSLQGIVSVSWNTFASIQLNSLIFTSKPKI